MKIRLHLFSFTSGKGVFLQFIASGNENSYDGDCGVGMVNESGYGDGIAEGIGVAEY
jgi:hypothetical protein